jgi:hypothetical protein
MAWPRAAGPVGSSEQHVQIEQANVTECRVNMMITFVLDD